MPVSKKRKKKQRYSPPPPNSKTAPKKKKITRQQIIIYVISGLMILSLAIGYLASGSSRTQTPATSAPQDTNIFVDTPVPDDQNVEDESGTVPDEPAESTEEN